MIRRAFLIILDSLGVGELPDAADYGDVGSNTLGNTAASLGGLELPALGALGLGNIIDVAGTPAAARPSAFFGKMRERSAGKDTTTGHWELTGIVLDKAFPTYPDGFPSQVMNAFEAAIGRGTLGNYPASGTEIIKVLGDEHVSTGKPIVYTSADSVFQIAAHEEVIPLADLYAMCRTARGILLGEHAVGRVIARPFIGTSGAYARTPHRHDFSLEPVGETLLDALTDWGVPVTAIGKIADIFTGRGITTSISTESNEEGMNALSECADRVEAGLIFANLVDFDMLYGHRNDVQGYADALKVVDRWLPDFIDKLRPDDLLAITADHGCDPTTVSTDHSREHIPLLVYSSSFLPASAAKRDLGVRSGFSDLGKTLADLLGLPGDGKSALLAGESFAARIKGALRGPGEVPA